MPKHPPQRFKGFAEKTFKNNGVPLRSLCAFAPLRWILDIFTTSQPRPKLGLESPQLRRIRPVHSVCGHVAVPT